MSMGQVHHTENHYAAAYQKFLELDTGQPGSILGPLCGVDPSTVLRWRREGEKRPLAHWSNIEGNETIETMLNDGASIAEIARTLGHSADKLYRRFPGRSWKRDQVMEFLNLMREQGKILSESKYS